MRNTSCRSLFLIQHCRSTVSGSLGMPYIEIFIYSFPSLSVSLSRFFLLCISWLLVDRSVWATSILYETCNMHRDARARLLAVSVRTRTTMGQPPFFLVKQWLPVAELSGKASIGSKSYFSGWLVLTAGTCWRRWRRAKMLSDPLPRNYSTLHNRVSGPEIGSPGRIMPALSQGGHRNRPSGRRADFDSCRQSKTRPGSLISGPGALLHNIQ